MTVKLIRDKLGRRIGLGPGDKVRLVDGDDEYARLLIEKLDEEYRELRKELVRKEVDIDKTAEEAADLLEVLLAIVSEYSSMDLGSFLEIAQQKRRYKGSFEGGIVLETKE